MSPARPADGWSHDPKRRRWICSRDGEITYWISVTFIEIYDWPDVQTLIQSKAPEGTPPLPDTARPTREARRAWI